ncbi:MAG: glycosyltransferase family 9 protein [Flavobacteriales bacterium]|nr:glycosyltransferase family 9 protein [Flavobacteriales bacterium]
MKLANILISRTDSIGDVLLTLPFCAWLKKQFPEAKLTFLGRNYTQSVIESFTVIDSFIALEQLNNQPTLEKVNQLNTFDCIIHVFPNKEIASLAKKAKIPLRIGTSHRLFHLLTCNKRVNFTRKNSELHEAQLNFELLKPLGLKEIPSFSTLQNAGENFKVKATELPTEIETLDFKNLVILHPKSQGSAIEWPLEKYIELAEELAKNGKTVCFTGTESEGVLFRHLLPKHSNIIDTSGKLSLHQLQLLISKSQALVACSTGPYHIAGLCGIKAIGLFSNRKPIHPGRWKALGKNAVALVFDENCTNCKSKQSCLCIQSISVEKVMQQLL